MPELLLAGEVLERASLYGNEYAWRRGDLAQVFAAAERSGLACLGGQVQFRLPGGTCELYWQNFGSADRRPSESWAEYVARARRETETSLAVIPNDDDLVQEGLREFPFLREQASRGTDVAGALCFVCYFLAE